MQADSCSRDAECGPENKCLKNQSGSRSCLDACEGVVCGPNARCNPENHIGRCQCLPDHFGDPDNLVNGCRLKEQNECEQDVDCIKSSDVCKPTNVGIKKCFNSCRFAVCGPNSDCVAKNHTYFCECKEGFVREPSTGYCIRRDDECREDGHCQAFQSCKTNALGIYKCVDVCLDFICSANSKCVAADHKGQCVCEPGFTGDPQSRQGCHQIPLNECPSGVNCAPQSQVGCKSDNDCPLDENCMSNQCINPCASKTSCGTNAICRVENHEKICSCRVGTNGHPYIECIRESRFCSGPEGPEQCNDGDICDLSICRHSCSNDAHCFDDEKCVNGLCNVICKSDDNCPNRQVCDNFLCRPGCRSDSECPSTDACINRKCINVCSSPSACGSNAICNPVNHAPWCTCPPKFTGNPRIECKSIDCVVDSDCPAKSICQNYNCIPGCRSNSACLPTESCISLQCTDPCRFSGVCGENAVCSAIDHQPRCSCKTPLIGNPLVRCSPPQSDDTELSCLNGK